MAAAEQTPSIAPVEDSEDEDEVDVSYNLGFVEEPEAHTLLLRHRFPSKVGGSPAWLDPVNLPSTSQLTCGATGKNLNFLLQVYAPLEANPQAAFHRTLFLFVSPDGTKLTQPGAVRALRCQLPRDNTFYPSDPPGEGDLLPRALQGPELERALATDPWRVAAGEQACTAEAPGPAPEGPSTPHVFPELELLVEQEEEEEDAEAARALASYHTRVAQEGEFDDEELPPEVLSSVEKNLSPEQRHFAMFQARIGSAPDQVLRYSAQPGASPLWPSTHRIPTPQDIPPCPCCHTPRQFEFQVLPTLLASLDLDEDDPHCPDWATIAVYSCPRACTGAEAHAREDTPGSAYWEEFVWVQGGDA